MQKRTVFIIILSLLLSSAAVRASDKKEHDFYRHEVRVGWGDQLFDKMIWHNTGYIVTTLPQSETLSYEEHYRYTQHVFAEYSYSFRSWLSAGLLFDTSSCIWDDVTRNGAGTEISRDANRYSTNLALMPNVRFTYFRRPYMDIYSGLGMGLAVNTGTTKNIYGRKTLLGFAGNVTLAGISGCYKQWSASAEVNAFASAQNRKHVFLMGSRIFTLSIGMRF